RRRPGHRPHRPRRRRAPALPRPGWAHRAHRGSRPPLRRRARHQSRAWRAACARERACLGGADGGLPVRGDGGRIAPGRRGRALLRLDPLSRRPTVQQLTFSGGVAEYIYGREAQAYGDLGVLLAQEIRARVEGWGPKLERASEGIRATVIGASQYTTQVSGST